MKKKWILMSVLFALCFGVFGIFPSSAEEETYSYPPRSEWTDAQWFTFDSSTGTITKYSKEGPKDVVIPEEINGVSVRYIGDEAFFEWNEANYDNVYHIQSLKLPKGLLGIGDYAFSTSLMKEVELPEGLIEIGMNAFYQSSLERVKFPSTLTTIGDSAFSNNELKELRLPDGVTEIGDSAFHCNQLKNIKLPKKITVIRNGAFKLNKLTQVAFPKGLTKIEEEAFIDNQLTEVTVPNDCEVDTKAFDERVVVRHGTLEPDPEPIPNKEDLFGDKVISDPKYSWTVTFNKSLDFSTVHERNFFSGMRTEKFFPILYRPLLGI